jgi:DNA-binding response OmpR family regulator
VKPRVFIAEQDPNVRLLLEQQLRSDGYETLASRNGMETIRALGAMRGMPFCIPDVIILDMHMPGYSGIEILGALRDAGWATPVIIVGIPADDHDVARRCGAAAVFDKPFDMADLRVALRTCWLDHTRTWS